MWEGRGCIDYMEYIEKNAQKTPKKRQKNAKKSQKNAKKCAKNAKKHTFFCTQTAGRWMVIWWVVNGKIGGIDSQIASVGGSQNSLKDVVEEEYPEPDRRSSD